MDASWLVWRAIGWRIRRILAGLFVAILAYPLTCLAPTQGDGAYDLIKPRPAKKAKVSVGVPPIPSVVIPPRTNYPVFFFAATAYDNTGLESDFSNEVAWTNSTRSKSLTLAWDPVVATNLSGYHLYQGRASATYTNIIAAGLSTQAVYYLPRPPTNLVVTIRTAAANLVSQQPFGRWMPLSPARSSLSLTNPTGPIFYRSYGNGSPVVISTRWY